MRNNSWILVVSSVVIYDFYFDEVFWPTKKADFWKKDSLDLSSQQTGVFITTAFLYRLFWSSKKLTFRIGVNFS